MNSGNNEKYEFEKALRETLKQDIPPVLEEKMRGSLREFREKLPNHPYVRSLEKKRRREGGHITLRVVRWKAILMAAAVGYVLLVTRTEAVRHGRITAMTEGRMSIQGTPSLIAGTNVRELNRELDRLLAQLQTEDLRGTDTP